MVIIKINDNKEEKIVLLKKRGYIALKQKDSEGEVIHFTIDNNQISALITALEDMKREVIQDLNNLHRES